MSDRPRRLYWLLGLGLLVGFVAGTGWVINHSPDGDPRRGAPKDNGPTDGIVCIGYVDVEPGVSFLHPALPGRVTDILAAENDDVPEGYLLLSLDNEQACLNVRRAKADLEAAQQQVVRAEGAARQFAEKVTQQKQAVEAMRSKLEIARNELTVAKKLYNDKLIKVEDKNIAEEKFKGMEAAVLIEESKLRELLEFDPDVDVRRAGADVSAKEAKLGEAQLALYECDVYAPRDGKVLRIGVSKGEVVGIQPRQPAIQFCPKLPRVIRAEVLQEWASRIEVGQTVTIEDDTRFGAQWTGRVKRISDWYTHRRSIIQEPFQFNDVRTLECIIAVDPSEKRLHIGQRVRVTIKQGGP